MYTVLIVFAVIGAWSMLGVLIVAAWYAAGRIATRGERWTRADYRRLSKVQR